MIHTFPGDIWNAFNEVELSATIKDKENPYQIVVEVELTDEFTEREFSFGFTQTDEDGESRYSYHSMDIRDNKLKMIEKKKGEFFVYRLVIKNKTYFNSLGKYNFSLESVMGKVKVNGIQQLSLEIIQL